MTAIELARHLEFFGELGVDGVRRDPEWRAQARVRHRDLRRDPDERTRGGSAPVGRLSPEPSNRRRTAWRSVRISRPTRWSARSEGRDRPDCTRCKLHTLGRKQVVFGVGNPNADLMFVGEAPGADEDIQGEPFVGRAGQLLTKIIEAIGLTREDVYIANVIKCRPPGNRNPEPDEVEQCEPFLFRQIDVDQAEGDRRARQVRGAVAAEDDGSDHAAARREFNYRGAMLIPTFHPAYLLRNPVGEARGLGGHEEGPRDPQLEASSPIHVRSLRLVISVAVPVPALDLLTYAVPDGHRRCRPSAPASSCRSARAR